MSDEGIWKLGIWLSMIVGIAIGTVYGHDIKVVLSNILRGPVDSVDSEMPF